MLLGKRPRRTIKRTPSLAELSVDMDTAEGAQASGGDPLQRRTRRPPMVMEGVPMTTGHNSSSSAWPPQQLQHYDPSDWLNNTNHPMVPTSKPRWHSTDLAGQPSGFLRVCGLCKRRLGPGRETFMYRGEVAFCSQECRQQQINLDEMKEKCFPASMKPPQSAPKSEASGDGKIVA